MIRTRITDFFAAAWDLRPARTDAERERRLGRAGERAAASFLRKAGFRILARNARVPMGEADIIALDPAGPIHVVVEVKTRRTRPDIADAIPPEANVHAAKRDTLAAIARYLARRNRWNLDAVRIDVVAVEWHDGRPPVIRHHRCVT